jgi:hypothetical protein
VHDEIIDPQLVFVTNIVLFIVLWRGLMAWCLPIHCSWLCYFILKHASN